MRVPLAGLAVLLLMSPATAAAPRTHVVVIDKMKFGPVPASLRPGDTIIWVNKDMFRHTATARNGTSAPVGVRIRVSASASRSAIAPDA